jgi:CheY-like chemotaxis protein
MGAKRALIVDDSKSARLFLARMLEKYEIDVDSADTAESAIEYLATHRPDVIFMDHLMPGMDGFQAVQAIKNNPLTATIPIMMYTSQEGELYLGQARALGAVGVLPKQIKPTDVSKVLYQLHLLQDRRSAYQTSFRALNVPAESPEAEQSAANDTITSKVLTETILREQFAELRRALVAGVDTQTDRITAEVRALLLEALPPPAEPVTPHPVPTPFLDPPRRANDAGWLVAGLAAVIALGTVVLWRQEVNQLRALKNEMAQLRQDVTSGLAAATSAPASARSAGLPAATTSTATAETSTPSIGTDAGRPGASQALKAIPTDSKPLVALVPYGAEALGGPRLELIRQLLDRLAKEGHGGVVDIKTFAGRFCLMGNQTDGYSLTPDETLFSKCDLIGNPAEDGLSVAQRIPLPFANLAGAVRNSSHGSLDVQASTGDVGATAAPYPPVATDLTAGEWNRAASANNRIEIRVR